MKLGSIRPQFVSKPESLDGVPVLVSRDNSKFVIVDHVVPHLRSALENWSEVESQLQRLSDQLNQGSIPQALPVDETQFLSPLPRSFQWVDGSAFIHHIKLVRRARNAPLPETLLTVPLMYQGGSDTFLAPYDEIPFLADRFDLDFEGEVAVITDHVPMGISAQEALTKIRLVLLVNDVSLRGLIPEELAQGFGFFQSKPSSAFSPFALTLDELGDHWREGRVHLPLRSELRGVWFGEPNAGEMHFHFGELIAHAARTRSLSAGTIVGSGTVSNEDASKGSSCIVEKRMIEKIETGEFKTPYMKPGDTIRIQMLNQKGHNLFGSIFQTAKLHSGG